MGKDGRCFFFSTVGKRKTFSKFDCQVKTFFSLPEKFLILFIRHLLKVESKSFTDADSEPIDPNIWKQTHKNVIVYFRTTKNSDS